MFGCTDFAKKKILIALMIAFFFSSFGVLNSQSAYANVLPVLDPIPAQDVYPDQNFVYRLTVTDVDGKKPIIRMLNAPSGATLTTNSDGSSDFNWQLPSKLEAEHVIIFQAVDAVDSSRFTTRRMVLQKGKSAAASNEAQSTESKAIRLTIKPAMVEPEIAESGVAEPITVKPAAVESVTAELAVAKPTAAEPIVAEDNKPEPTVKIAELSSATVNARTAPLADSDKQPKQINQDTQLSSVLSSGAVADDFFKESFSLAILVKYVFLLIPFAYVVFVFVAEDFNPLVNPRNPMKRKRWRLGRAAAIACIVGGACSVMFMQKLQWSSSLALACFLCLTLILLTPSFVKYKRAQVWH